MVERDDFNTLSRTLRSCSRVFAFGQSDNWHFRTMVPIKTAATLALVVPLPLPYQAWLESK
jgi:hypothetical protein